MQRITARALSDLVSKPYSLVHASPCRFRFVDVEKLLSADLLEVFETDEFPPVYATTSFVWRGLQSTGNDEDSFAVVGVEGEPRVSLQVLRTVCRAARVKKCSYLWLDKLSVRQDRSPEGSTDTIWQVQRMYEIYRRCQVCLVVAGGLSRLPSLEEPTTWMDRGWTLQEALAPPSVNCLFSWDKGDAILQHNAPVEIVSVEDGLSAMADLHSLLGANSKSSVKVIDPKATSRDWDSLPSIELRMLGSPGTADRFSIEALLGALDHTDSKENDARVSAVWRCIILRSSKLRQDMIFGCMGVLGATLSAIPGTDPKEPYSDDQFNRLTINLVKHLASKGVPAVWLGLIPELGAAPAADTLPLLPSSNTIGSTTIPTIDGRSGKVKNVLPRQTDMWWWLANAPAVKVADDGAITLSRRVTLITKHQGSHWTGANFRQLDNPDKLIQCDNNQEWTIDSARNSKSYAVDIGKKVRYVNGFMGMLQEFNTTLLMLVEPKPDGRLHNIGYAWGDQDIARDWSEQQLTVGG